MPKIPKSAVSTCCSLLTVCLILGVAAAPALAANLPAPTLLTPSNGTTNVSSPVTFSWTAVKGANSGYRIMVTTNLAALPSDPTASACGGCAINDTPAGTTYSTSGLPPGQTYYWEVHGRSTTLFGAWSSRFAFTLPSQTATPSINPGSGTYGATQSVTITDATAGASIYYTTNGSTPATSSARYTTPIPVSISETVRAIAVASGHTQSGVATASYTIQTPTGTPAFSPGPGTYSAAQSVTITDATAGASIYYTTNGSTPATSSTRYTTPILVSASETIRAIAVVSGHTQSGVASAAYTIQTTAPEVTAVSPQYIDKYFLTGSPMTNIYQVSVNWHGASPGTVKVVYNGTTLASASANSSGASVPLNLSAAPSSPGAMVLQFVATSASGKASSPWQRQITLVGLPAELQPWIGVAARVTSISAGTVHFKFDAPIQLVKEVYQPPFIGKFGLEFTIDASLDLASDGTWTIQLSSGGGGCQSLSTNKQPTCLDVDAGDYQFSGSISVSTSGTVTLNGVTPAIALTKLQGTGEISGDATIATFTPVLVLPSGISGPLENLPVIGSFVKTLSVDLDASVDAQIQAEWDSPIKLQAPNKIGGSINVGLKLDKDFKAGDLAHIEFYAQGGLDSNWHYPPPLFNGADLSLSLGYDYSINYLVGELQGGKECKVFDVRFQSSGLSGGLVWSCGGTSPSTRVLSTEAAVRPANRSYLDRSGPRFSESSMSTAAPVNPAGLSSVAKRTDTLLLQNVIHGTDHVLAARGSEQMLLYVSDTGAPDTIQFTSVYWTYFDGSRWSTPQPVSDDPRGQFRPQVAFDGNGDAVAVWERYRDPNMAATSIQTVLAQMEVVWSRWDQSAMAWSSPAPVTADGVLTHAPLLAGPLGDGSVILVLTRNAANQAVGTGPAGAPANDQVFAAKWVPPAHAFAPFQLLAGAVTGRSSQSLAASGATAVYAWSQSVPNDGTKPYSMDIFYCNFNGTNWSPATRLTNDAGQNRSVRAAIAPAGSVYLMWQRGSDLVIDKDYRNAPEVVRANSESLADYAFTVGPDGHGAILWQGHTRTGFNGFYKPFDAVSGRWGQDQPLFSDTQTERSFSPAWTGSGELAAAYNRVIPDRTLPHNQYEADLAVVSKAFVMDLGLSPDAAALESDAASPGRVTVRVTIHNLGDLPAQDAEVSFYSGDPDSGGRELGRKTAAGWLDSGDSRMLEQTIDLSGSAPAAIYVAIDPDNKLGNEDRAASRVVVPLR